MPWRPTVHAPLTLKCARLGLPSEGGGQLLVGSVAGTAALAAGPQDTRAAAGPDGSCSSLGRVLGPEAADCVPLHQIRGIPWQREG